MTDEKLKEFKTRLTAERKLIADKIHRQQEEEKGLCRGGNDGFAEQDNHPALELLEMLTGSELKLMEEIDLALTKFESGSYGICKSCAGEISLNRLEAKPSASLCQAVGTAPRRIP